MDSPQQSETGMYGQIRSDFKLEKDECTGFIQKGCLSNIAQATFAPDGGYDLRTEFLHDVVIGGVNLGVRAGLSLEHESDKGGVTPGFALRGEF